MKKNPDSWIRKAVKDRLDGMVVNNVAIPAFDKLVPGPDHPDFFVIISSQTRREVKGNKCYSHWDCTLLLDLVSRYPATSGGGSSAMVNDMEETILTLMEGFQIGQGFTVYNIELESSINQDRADDTENVFRQLMRYRLTIYE